MGKNLSKWVLRCALKTLVLEHKLWQMRDIIFNPLYLIIDQITTPVVRKSLDGGRHDEYASSRGEICLLARVRARMYHVWRYKYGTNHFKIIEPIDSEKTELMITVWPLLNLEKTRLGPSHSNLGTPHIQPK